MKKNSSAIINYNKFLQAFNQGSYSQAEKLARKIISKKPHNGLGQKALGTVLAAMGKYQEALQHLKKALSILPASEGLHSNLGAVLRRLGRIEEAENQYQRSLDLNPDSAATHSNLANLLRITKRYRQALYHAQKSVEIHPDYVEGNLNLGSIYVELGKYEEAESCFQKVLKLRPEYSECHNNLGTIYQEMGNIEEAKKHYYMALKFTPDYPEVYANLADLYEKENNLDDLRQILREAKLHCKDQNDIILHEARLLIRENNFILAREVLEKCQINHTTKPATSAGLFNLLASTYERLNQFDNAFNYFTKSNQVMSNFYSHRSCSKDRYLSKINNAIQPPTYNNPPLIPVFLVGYPRSGTTLLDTILRSHPEITVVEEKDMVNVMLRGGDYFQELGKHIDITQLEGLLVDKLPLNIVHVREIKACFPEAKFILVLRHPCDCVLSCFMQNFGPNDAMANMLNLEDAAFLYDKAMTIWKESGVDGHIVKYEDVVDDLEGTIKPLLDYLGLEWSEEITNYAETARKRGRINTPSYHQVVRPLYKTSVGRWKNYQKHMEPVLPVLLPWAEYWGYEKPKQRSNKKMPEITIDGKEYDTDKLSNEAKNQLISIQFVDKKLQEVQLEQAAYQTARNAYAKALSEILQKEQGQN